MPAAWLSMLLYLVMAFWAGLGYDVEFLPAEGHLAQARDGHHLRGCRVGARGGIGRQSDGDIDAAVAYRHDHFAGRLVRHDDGLDSRARAKEFARQVLRGAVAVGGVRQLARARPGQRHQFGHGIGLERR